MIQGTRNTGAQGSAGSKAAYQKHSLAVKARQMQQAKLAAQKKNATSKMTSKPAASNSAAATKSEMKAY